MNAVGGDDDRRAQPAAVAGLQRHAVGVRLCLCDLEAFQQGRPGGYRRAHQRVVELHAPHEQHARIGALHVERRPLRPLQMQARDAMHVHAGQRGVEPGEPSQRAQTNAATARLVASNKPCGGGISARALTRFPWLDAALAGIDVHRITRLHGGAAQTSLNLTPRIPPCC